jgi:hypothetical protein
LGATDNESPLSFFRPKKQEGGELSLKLSKWMKNRIGGATSNSNNNAGGESAQNFDNT